MTLDPPTLLAASVLATGLMAVAYLAVWTHDRRETAILWMVAATVLGCTGGALRDVLVGTVAIVVVNVVLFSGLSCIATACRALAGRRPSPTGLLAPAVLWIVACGVPAVLGDQASRVVLASLGSAAIMAWAVLELWCGPRESRRARLALTGVLGLHGLASLGRGIGAALTQGTPQPGLVRSADLTLVTLWSLGFLLLVGFGVIFYVMERATDRFRHAADEDVLTGLPNRRRFDAALEAGCRGATRTGQPFSLLMIDVDAFKAYNDACGHPAGDRLLRAVADVLAAAAARHGGLAARYGGEEFAILLPAHDDAAALAAADDLRRRVRALAVPHPGSAHGLLTISVGIATAAAHAAPAAWDLLRTADRGLYAAKRAGRDGTGREGGNAVERAA